MELSSLPRIFKKSAAGARAPRVVSVLAGLLERAAERGDADASVAAASHTASASASAAFRGKAVPGIPVRRYAERIYRYAGCSPACFVVAYVYLDRLARGRVGEGEGEEEEGGDGEGEGGEEKTAVKAVVCVDSYNVHRLLITSVLVAAKFMDDRHNNNAYFARVGGVEVSEMNKLELRLLFALRFRLNVHPDTFARYCAELQGVMADDDPAVPLPLTVTTTVCDDNDGKAVVVTTKPEKKGVTAAVSAVPPVVGVHSHHHRGAVVVQIMATAQ